MPNPIHNSPERISWFRSLMNHKKGAAMTAVGGAAFSLFIGIAAESFINDTDKIEANEAQRCLAALAVAHPKEDEAYEVSTDSPEDVLERCAPLTTGLRGREGVSVTNTINISETQALIDERIAAASEYDFDVYGSVATLVFLTIVGASVLEIDRLRTEQAAA